MSAQSGQQPRHLGLTLAASTVAVVHTYLAFAAFFSALFVGSCLHYKKIVKNGVAGYPEEWFPSVSATIGDWYPERNIFQILIAINSGPRFALVFLQYFLQKSTSTVLPTILLFTGVLRTLSCGGWVFITSTDDHDWHDILMISYIVLNLPWMLGGIACTAPENVKSRRRRRIIATTFFGSLVPMIYFFIRHKVHRIPGAYTHYSFFEWGLIILDILYDSVAKLDLEAANLQITIGTPSTEKGGGKDIAIVASSGNVYSIQVTSQTVSEKEVSRAATAPPTPKLTHATLSDVPTVWTRLSPSWSFICDVYLSYINWSVFTSLTPTLFYFSIWELALAGSELTLLATLSPIVLGIPFVLTIFSTRAGRTVLHVLSLTGLGAYVLTSPAHRLFAVTFANFALFIGWAIDWSVPMSSIGYQGIITGLGLFLSSLSKHANHGNNPVWPFVHAASGGYNKTGILLACLAIYDFYTRKQNPAAPEEAKESKAPASNPVPVRKHSILDGVAFGSLLFTLHCFLSDPSTLIAWSWTGYPVKGPLPILHGSLTHVAQAIGLLLPILTLNDSGLPGFLSHPLWFAYGCAGAYVTYAYRDWLGYIGGLNFAVFLSSIIPVVMSRAACSGHVARTYATAMLVVSLFDVFSTFTVAYAFVPMGEYFRERTDLILLTQMAMIAFAFRWPSNAAVPVLTLSRAAKSRAKNALGVLTLLSLLVTLYRWPADPPRPHRPGPRILRAGIWTVHFGLDNEGRDSQRRMRDLIRDMELDVVGLLETDLQRVVYGNRDLTRVMAEELGFYVDIGPGPEKHTWGAVLLSKFPIINSTHHLLPAEETPLDRELQSTELARIMSSVYPEPLIYLGYVVTQPHASRPAPYDILVTDGRVHDIDKDDWDRWCEYILYRGLYRTAYARVSRSTITDTELQIGQWIVPKYGVGITNDTEEGRYLRAWKEELPEEHWFPPEYYQDQGGVRGHYYHVFNTPLYYKLPEGAVL
ncbi:hypothetical protein NM688_g1829 [Phlebia brevispora]|uniref:Uncharacterized protein n=1 Tax=Phlebia brevispora TaxID=194682 RepID=A0ACC1TAK5_9APHY|nr:hypothetical protein NM688_g1829 [Phlebia brevispora]